MGARGEVWMAPTSATQGNGLRYGVELGTAIFGAENSDLFAMVCLLVVVSVLVRLIFYL